jgi:homoserine kinase type II
LPETLDVGKISPIRTLGNVFFCLTPFCEGAMINAGEVNADQMYHLGQVTGRMHKLLSLIPQRKVDWTPNWDDLCHKWLQNWKKANVQGRSEAVIQGIESQRVILEQLDLSFFDDCEIGWTHWDLFVDNLLFFEKEVSAILDFDRVTVIYPELDISRAVLSCALKEDVLRPEVVAAFLDGYNEIRPFTSGELVRPIKLLWCHESPKWIRPYRTLVVRYKCYIRLR